MSNHVFADGPFRIDQTFSLPSSSYGIVGAASLGEVSMITPALIEPDQIRADAILSENMQESEGEKN
jgi:hypothetical protein